MLDQTRGFRYRAPVSTRNTRQRQSNQQFSVSYFAGSHSFKAGLYMLEGFVDSDIMPTGNGVSYGFLNNAPAQLTQTKRTVTHEVVNPELGLFIQDQWILNRLTVNDALLLEREGELLAGVSPVVMVRSQIVGGAGNWRAPVNGVSTAYQEIRDWPVASGAFFEDADVQALEVRAELGQQRQLGECAVGDDQRALQALLEQVRADERARTGAEVDRRWEREAGDAHGACQMISK